MKEKLSSLIISVATLLPGVVMAQAQIQDSYIVSVLALISRVFNALIPILIAIIVVFFIWSLIQFVRSSSDEDHTKARNHMIWGIIAIFVAVSIWGLVGLLQDITNVDSGGLDSSELPTVPIVR